jgi:adenylate cyclase
VQDEVIAQVVSAIAVKLTDTEQTRIARLPTDNLEAYDYYLRAEQGVYLTDTAVLRATLSYYEKAIALDPKFADAYAGLARAAVEIWRLDYSDLLASAVARKRAYEAAARALVLDSDNARAYSVLAVLQLVDGQHDAAIASARKAVSFAPSDAEAYLNLGLVLAYSGRPTEARATVESALRLNPKPAPGALFLAGIGFFADGQYERAVEAVKQARDARPTHETSRLYLASAYAHLGRMGAAKAEVEALLEIIPIANLEYYRVRDAYYKREEDLTTYIDGLRKAGMSEWPFGFRGDEEDRLDGRTLKAVTLGHTWMGRHANGVQFVQQISRTGIIAYRSRTSFLTGTAEVYGNMLCQQFEGYIMDRRLCGHVYRNPTGTREKNDEYISVMPDALKYFSVVQ